MFKDFPSTSEHPAEDQELRARLAEAEQTLAAIRSGGVDALVTTVNGKERIFTLEGADYSYRTLIEVMQQGAVITNSEGLILYANQSFAGLVETPLEWIISSFLCDWIAPQSQPVLTEIIRKNGSANQNREILLKGKHGTLLPVVISSGTLAPKGEPGELWMIVTDLREIIERKKYDAAVQERLSNEKIQAEAALRSANYSRSLIEASLDPLVTIDEDGKITDVNEASVQITGLSRPELIGTDFSSYFTDPDAARRGYEQVFNEGFVKDYPLTIRRADGRITDVLYNASLFRDEYGEVKGVFAAARDITAKKAAEITASRLASIVEFSLDAIIGMDTGGIITSWNQGATQLFGYTAAEMVGTSNMRLIPSDRCDKEREIMQKVIHGENVMHMDSVRISKRGTEVHVSLTVSPIKDSSGRVTGISKVIHDITDRKLAEEEVLRLNSELEQRVQERTMALSISEERLRMATTAAGIGIWDWDLSSNKVTWDKLMFSIYGMTENKNRLIPYEDWARLVHPDDLAQQEVSLRGIIETKGYKQREFRIIRASDKATRIIRASDAVIVDATGKTTHVVGINLDITDTMEMMEKIRTLNSTLKNRAAELEASVKELDSFSYSVSHDLRSPLRAIDGFSRIVAEDYAPKLDDEGRRLIEVIRSEAQRMGRLIDDLLAFSRLGRQKVEAVVIDMEGMARQVFDEVASRETGRSINLDLHPIPQAVGTEAMIRQLWVNLIGNAVKFTSKRESAEIAIGVIQGEQGVQGENQESGEQIYFIRDNGAGFDMRYVDKLFGVFQRLHTKEEFPGTGVGLALVQRIVIRHGGRIWGEGEVDKGATFFFTIPNPEKPPTGDQEPVTNPT